MICSFLASFLVIASVSFVTYALLEPKQPKAKPPKFDTTKWMWTSEGWKRQDPARVP